jgi:hypothetical protein
MGYSGREAIMSGELRHRRAVDAAAGLLVVLAAVEAAAAAGSAGTAGQPFTPVDPLASIAAAGAALVTAVVLAAGARWPGVRDRARPAAAGLVAVAALGWCVARLAQVRALDGTWIVPADVTSSEIRLAAAGAILVTAAFATLAAVRLRSDLRAGEIAAAAVVTWGATELAALSASPGAWLDVSPALYAEARGNSYHWGVVVEAAAVPAAALVVLWWLTGPRPGTRRIAARCRGACAAVAVLLLAEAFLSVAGLPDSLPRVVALGAGAACAAVAAARWPLALLSAPVAAAAGLVSLLNHVPGEDGARDVLFPEPAHWVTVGLAPVVVAVLVLWGSRRPSPQPLEPAGVPAVPVPAPPGLQAEAALPSPADGR